jgi:hypothetical protein
LSKSNEPHPFFLSSFLSAESLARNMHAIESSSYVWTNPIQATERMYCIQVQNLRGTIEEMGTFSPLNLKLQPSSHYTLIALPLHRTLVTCLGSHTSFLETVKSSA